MEGQQQASSPGNVATPQRRVGDQRAADIQTPEKEPRVLIVASRGKKMYDVVGDPQRAADDLRADFSAFQASLRNTKLEDVDDVVAECTALRKWMRAVEDVDFAKERDQLQDFESKAIKWKAGQEGGGGGGEGSAPAMFPFAARMGRGFDDIVRCVDRLKEIYGKDLDGMGIHLPMIIAVGMESAGKSSVMEMIAGQPFFPRSEGICTRLPFRLQFRRSPQLSGISVSFQNIEALEGRKFGSPLEVQQQIIAITKQRTNNEDVSSEEVVLNIEMGDVPDLTLVDLPGLVGSSYSSEKKGLKERVHGLVKSYISEPHAIVLAVASAQQRLRDSEIFGMVKEAGAEHRTIGLLTKCDLATEKRYRLEDKLNGKFSSADQKEQERIGFIPLSRGYYGMICRDTESLEQPMQEEQTQAAILEAQRQEKRTFDDLEFDQTARGRCGTENVYNTLTSLFQEYIQDSWRPDTMRKLGERIGDVKAELEKLRFSDRYEDPPPKETNKTTKYTQELQERIIGFSSRFIELLHSYELSDKLSERFAAVETLQLPRPMQRSDNAQYLNESLQPLKSKLEEALHGIATEIRSCTQVLLTKHAGTQSLPELQKFVLEHIAAQASGLVEKAVQQVACLIELEGSVPFPVGPKANPDSIRVPLVPQLGVPVGLLLSDESECSVCHSPMVSDVNPLDLLRCCSKHFHRHCLDEIVVRTSHNHQPSCPLCRTQFGRQSTNAPRPDAAAREAAWQQLKTAQERIILQSRKAASLVLCRLQGLSSQLRQELANKALEIAFTSHRHFLEEMPELQNRRAALRRKLSVLLKVQEDLEEWGEI